MRNGKPLLIFLVNVKRKRKMDKHEFLHIELAKKYHETLKKKLEEIEKNIKSKGQTEDDTVRSGRDSLQTSE
tara:strand:- start:283 stop:498 length:216 start_codon:yes stop_codon:yes gene_type:complete